jgi:hypothetical protein
MLVAFPLILQPAGHAGGDGSKYHGVADGFVFCRTADEKSIVAQYLAQSNFLCTFLMLWIPSPLLPME